MEDGAPSAAPPRLRRWAVRLLKLSFAVLSPVLSGGAAVASLVYLHAGGWAFLVAAFAAAGSAALCAYWAWRASRPGPILQMTVPGLTFAGLFVYQAVAVGSGFLWFLSLLFGDLPD